MASTIFPVDGDGEASYEALLERDACFRALLEAAFDGVLISQNGLIAAVSESLLARSGYTRDGLIGRPLTDVVAEDFRDDVRRRLSAGIEGRFETAAILSDGRRLPIEVVTKKYEIRGRPARVTAVRDASEQAHARGALQQSERKLSAAARLARLGYWEDDVEGDRITWSEETCRMLGLPLTDRTRTWTAFTALVHPDDLPAVRDARARVWSGQSSHPVAFRAVLPDGRTRYVETVAESIKEPRGRVTRIVGTIQDVSERKKTDDDLRRSQERLHIALQAAGLGPWDWDLTTNRVDFWPEWKRQIGYEPDEISDRYEEWESRLHPDDREPVLAALRAYLDGREAEYALEFRLRHKDGTYRWIYTRGVALDDASGRRTRMFGCHLDITERKQLEQQYRQSQKMQAIGQLAGGIAHDFNNLLVVIGGYAEVIADELGPAHPSQPDLDDIRAAAGSAASLIRQLLAFSRRQILQPQILDLNAVLRRSERLLGRIIGEHITLTLHLSARSRVSADPGQIEQVMMNLAVNARDAMPEGGRLTIETADIELDRAYVAGHDDATAGRHVVVAVSDTGSGMDERTRARLFEPFFTTKPHGKGTGLGLATVYGIVKQSRGSISVYSEPGRGTTFRVYLPVAGGGAEAPQPAVDPLPARGSETVLVVEDQPEVRGIIEKTLNRYGYTVLTAATGPEAIATAQAHVGPIHVLLADVILPGASGRDTARQIVATRPSMRVLYMSGYTDDAIVQHGVLEPGLAFIQKPFARDALPLRIREVLAADPPPPV